MGACFSVESGLVRVRPDSDAEAYVWGVAPFLGDSSVLVILLNVAPRKLVSSQVSIHSLSGWNYTVAEWLLPSSRDLRIEALARSSSSTQEPLARCV